MDSERRPITTGVLISFASLVVIIAGLKTASPIVIPLLVAGFIALILSPPLFYLQRSGLPTWAALSIIVISLVLVLATLTLLLSVSVEQIASSLPHYEARLTEHLGVAKVWLDNKGLNPSHQDFTALVDPALAVTLFGRLVNGFGNILANGLLILFAVLFILMEASAFPAKIRYLLPRPEQSLVHLARFVDTVKTYLVIKSVMSLITGAGIALYLIVIGVDFALLWGWIAFFMNFVPYVGSLIAAIPVIVLTLLDPGPDIALLVAFGYLAINILVGNVIEPRYLGQGLDLSTLVVFLSLVFWGWLFGPVGMFLSAPLTMLLKIAAESHPNGRGLSVLLGSTAPQEDAPSAPHSS